MLPPVVIKDMIRSDRHWEGDTVIAVDIVDDGIESL